MKIFITGGTTGIGWELAKSYLLSGDTVAICGRDLNKLPEDAHKNFSRLHTYQLSVTDKDALATAVEEFSKNVEPQGLEMMVANAGRSHGAKTSHLDFEISRNIIEVNVMGVLNAFEPALEIMLKKKEGTLVAVASVAGFVGLPGASAYCASKAAVVSLCESYQLDLKDSSLEVCCICPGFVDTPLTRQNNHPMPWLMTAPKAAAKIRKAIEEKKALYLFPWKMKGLILFLNRIPRAWYRLIMKTFVKYP